MARIIIDPGHGGRDPGGGSNHLWKEKDFVLQISLYQERRLKELGAEVLLTRDEDVTLSASRRARLVRESMADCCISNHINAGGGEGAETIRSIKSDGNLAKLILEALARSGQRKRRVYFRTSTNNPAQDFFFMHRNTGNIETVIVEYGFADNDNDIRRLQENWEIYAEAAVFGICQYVKHPYVAPNDELKNSLDLLLEHDITKLRCPPPL